MMLHIPVRRPALVILAATLLVLSWPVSALAHSELQTPIPADKSTSIEPVGRRCPDIFTEAMATNGSSLIVKRPGGAIVAQGRSIRRTASGWWRRRPRRSARGSYVVEWTTVATTAHVERGTWTFTVALTPTRPAPRPRPRRRPPRTAATRPSAVRAPAPSAVRDARRPVRRRPVGRSDARPIGRRRHDGEWRRCRPSDRRGAHRAGCGGRLPAHATQSSHQRHVTGDLRRRLATGVGAALALRLRPARDGGRPHAERRPTRAACRSRSTSSAPRRRSPCRSCSSSSATCGPRRRPIDGRPDLPPALAARSACARSASSAGRGSSSRGSPAASSDGDVATLFLWVYGWVGAGDRLARSSARPGTCSTRSRRSTTSAPWSCGGSASRAGTPADYPARARPLAGRRRLRVLRLARARRRRPAPSTLFVVLVGYTAFTLAMMAQFGRDDVARARRDLHRLVPAPRPARRVRASSTRTVASAERSFASGLLEPGWTAADVVLVALGVGVDPLRRPVADAALVRRCSARPALAGKTLLLVRLPRDRRRRLALVRGADSSGVGATGAGLLPIAVGYLIAHYLTYLLIDGQRHRHRHLRPVPAGLGPVRDGVLRADRRLAAARPRLDRSSWPPSSAATCSGAWAGHVRGRRATRRPGIGRARRCARRADPARGRHGRPDHADALVARPGDRRDASEAPAGSVGSGSGRRVAAATAARRHPLVERADVGEPVGDRRVERLGGGDRGLDRGQAQDPLGDRGVADLGGVADRRRSAASAC